MSPPKPPFALFPPQLSARDAKARRWLLRKGRKHPGIEFGYLVGVESPYKFKFPGVKGNVSIPKGDASIAIARRTIFVRFHHNHPSKRSLSDDDLALLLRTRAFQSMWAHGNDGSIYRAKVKCFIPQGQEATVALLREMFKIATVAARLKAPPSHPRFSEVTFFVPHIVAQVLHERGIIEFSGSVTILQEHRWTRNSDVLEFVLEKVRQVS